MSSIEAKGGQAFLIRAEFGRPGAIDKAVSELEAELLRRIYLGSAPTIMICSPVLIR